MVVGRLLVIIVIFTLRIAIYSLFTPYNPI